MTRCDTFIAMSLIKITRIKLNMSKTQPVFTCFNIHMSFSCSNNAVQPKDKTNEREEKHRLSGIQQHTFCANCTNDKIRSRHPWCRYTDSRTPIETFVIVQFTAHGHFECIDLRKFGPINFPTMRFQRFGRIRARAKMRSNFSSSTFSIVPNGRQNRLKHS
uniref:Uncharacterized protein n=1 Tax=Sipha flava TaxID=143950 RepID=A0A2S2QP91_9HEMI